MGREKIIESLSTAKTDDMIKISRKYYEGYTLDASAEKVNKRMALIEKMLNKFEESSK